MKTLKPFFLILSAIVCLGNTSCSDDDDSMSASDAISNIGVLDSKTGLKLKSISSQRYNLVELNYDANDKLEDVLYAGGTLKISGNQFILNNVNDHDNYDHYNISFNGSGYVSEISASKESESYKSTFKASMSYSGGYLTKATYEGYSKESNYDETWSGTYTLNWKDGLLKTIESSTKWDESHGTGRSHDKCSYQYEKNENRNKYAQYPECIAKCLYELIDDINFLPYVGLLGKGPSFLPVGVEIEETYEDEYGKNEEDYDESFFFSFNSDGTISKESRNGGTYYYAYITGNDDYDVKSNNTFSSSSWKTEKQLSRRERAQQRKAGRRK